MIRDGLNIQEGEIRSYLLIGQSNMAGRGDIGSVPPIQNKNCLMLRMGRWQKMSEPINPDRAIFEGKPRSDRRPHRPYSMCRRRHQTLAMDAG